MNGYKLTIPEDLVIQNKFYRVVEEIKDAKNPRETIEKRKLSSKCFGKIIKAYLARNK